MGNKYNGGMFCQQSKYQYMIYHDFVSVIMKLVKCGRKYCSTSAEHSEARMLQYFPSQVNDFIITLAKSNHDNYIIFIYFMMKVSDDFQFPVMVMVMYV